MTDLNASQTLEHLKQAYTCEAQANMRYHFASRLADAVARPDVAHVLRAAADEERGHALGFLDLMIEHGANAPELVSATLVENLKASIEAELHEFSALYTRYAEVAAQEGFAEIARWFLALAEAGRTHARWLQQCLDGLEAKP
ncbi:MAG: rubrerythrin [Gammaproteobacteria bacterium]|nr:rubrerythrin [Gammaproteobacteria bacterium]